MSARARDARLPTFFVAGFQKCATTWLHDCLGEHPQVYVPERHMLHFFDIHFESGVDWYREHYRAASGALAIGDTTASYGRASLAPERIAEYAPHAKLVFALRNPVDRAFSHYWHEKKKGRFDFAFEEVFSNYDLFDSWVVTGFYHLHLRRFLEQFSRDQILVLVTEEIAADPEAALKGLYGFLGVDPAFRPRIAHQRSNRAHGPAAAGRDSAGTRIRERLARALGPLGRASRPSEYELGVPADARRALQAIFAPHNRALEACLGRSFDPWPRGDGRP